jgi:hypothetical protein
MTKRNSRLAVVKKRSSGTALSSMSMRSSRSSFSSSIAPSNEELMIEGLKNEVMGLGATAKLNFRFFVRNFAGVARSDFRIVEFLELLVESRDVSEDSFVEMIKVFDGLLTL